MVTITVNTSTMSKGACLALAAFGVYQAYKWVTTVPRNKLAEEIFQAEDEIELAEECLTDVSVTDMHNCALLGPDVKLPASLDDEGHDEMGFIVRPRVVDSTAKLEVRGSRILLSQNRGKYARRVLDACKAKFGTPKTTEANHRAVWRFAQQLMKDHGLRPSHQQELLPTIVTLAFQPSLAELRAQCVVGSYKAMRDGKFDEHLSRIARWTRKCWAAFGLE